MREDFCPCPSKASGASQGRIVVIDFKLLLEPSFTATQLALMRLGETGKAVAVTAFSGCMHADERICERRDGLKRMPIWAK